MIVMRRLMADGMKPPLRWCDSALADVRRLRRQLNQSAK